MSGKNLELSLIMRLRDLASSGFTKAQRDIQSAISKTESATANLTRTVGNLGKARTAAEVLGMRTEQNIQREIQRTQAAYERLQKSGTMSMREQGRAAEATRSKIRELNNEMGKYSLGQRAASGLRTGASIAAGAAAGAYVLSKPVGQTMDYGMRLMQISNMANTEQNTAGRIAGKREINAQIVAATRSGGGTREGTTDALNSLVADWQNVGPGAVPFKAVLGMLPSITKAASASGSQSEDLAKIAMRATQTFGIKPADVGHALDMANTAGKEGGFELKDMAKWLPAQMAAAKTTGMSGPAGLAKLLAANQASAITSGTKDEAGNNLLNLLLKINSNDTKKDAQRLGIDLSGTLAAARGKGMDSLDAFVGLVDSIVGKDKNYQALQTKLKTAVGPERKEMLQSQADILQGSSIGKIVQDRQALMALVGIMGNRGYVQAIQQKGMADWSAAPGKGSVDQDFAGVSQEPAFKVQQAANEKTFATTNAFERLTPLIGKVADGMTEHAREYPLLTAATVAATTALSALAVAAAASGLVGMLGGKGAGLTGLLAGGKNLVTGAAGMLGRGALAVGGAAFSLGGAAVTGAGAAGYGIGTLGYNLGMKGTEFNDNIGGMLATIMASLGSKEAQEGLNVTLHLDGEQIATVVNRRNARTASRN